MNVDKVILRAFLSTLAAIGALLVFIAVSLCAIFPSTMMGITYDLGMESASIHFAERAYKGSEDIYFIAYATEVAIQEGKTDKIVACGDRLIADEEFDGYCAQKGDSYAQLIYAQVSVGKYKQGAKDEAIALAYDSLNGGFPKYNPLVSVLVAAIEAKDTETVDKIRGKLLTIDVEGEEKSYLDQTLAVIGK